LGGSSERNLDHVDAGDAPAQREQLAAARPSRRRDRRAHVLAPLFAHRRPPPPTAELDVLAPLLAA
jgi:hypothetical protein